MTIGNNWDRFIPNRSQLNHYRVFESFNPNVPKTLLAQTQFQAIYNNRDPESLHFNPKPLKGHIKSKWSGWTTPAKTIAHTSYSPTSIVDSPDIDSSSFVQRMDFSHYDYFAIALDDICYLQSPKGMITELPQSDSMIKSIRWSPNGLTLAMSFDNKLEVTTLGGETLTHLDENFGPLDSTLTSLDWLDENNLLFNQEGELKLFDIRTGRVSTQFSRPRFEVTQIRFKSGSSQVALGSNDGTVAIVDPRSNRTTREFKNGDDLASMAWLKRNNPSFIVTVTKNRLNIVNSETGACENTSDLSFDEATQVACSNDAIVVGHRSGNVTVWDPKDLFLLHTCEKIKSKVLNLVISPIRQQAHASHEHEVISAWDLPKKKGKAPFSSTSKLNSITIR